MNPYFPFPVVSENLERERASLAHILPLFMLSKFSCANERINVSIFRYLYLRWGVELLKTVVFVGESGETDYEGLFGGLVVLKGVC